MSRINFDDKLLEDLARAMVELSAAGHVDLARAARRAGYMLGQLKADVPEAYAYAESVMPKESP